MLSPERWHELSEEEVAAVRRLAAAAAAALVPAPEVALAAYILSFSNVLVAP